MIFIFIFIYFYIKNHKTLNLITYIFKITPFFKIGKGIKCLNITSLLVIFEKLIKTSKYLKIAP